jgi:hypothetical protein
MALLAHLGLHGDQPIGGLLADIVFLLGPALMLGALWLVMRRRAR